MTRERLYLDTMQEVFSQTSKVLVTGQQGREQPALPAAGQDDRWS
ncbi:hypothetical protein ACPA9J_05110 [Pseudomonas aeruginosa]